jgi:hypothetical protein
VRLSTDFARTAINAAAQPRPGKYAPSLIARAGGCPAGERDDAAVGVGVAELLVFQGELVDGADKGGDVGAVAGELVS